MIENKRDLIKRIDWLRNKKISVDFETLEEEGFERSLIRSAISEDFIKGHTFCLSLTDKGEKVLRDYLIIEGLNKRNKKIKVIFDSNIYDLIADGSLDINLLFVKKDDFEFYITHIQIDEINKCPDEDKRARLFLFKSKLSPIVIPTESFILGTSRLGEARLGDGEILEEIRKENLKHTEDALIGETAIKKNLLLVTEDNKLKNNVISLNGKALNLEEFKESLR